MRHQPSFTVARLAPAPQEPVRVEAGGMVATSYGVHMRSRPHLVFGVAGPGRVLTQTRDPSALPAWLRARMPSR